MYFYEIHLNLEDCIKIMSFHSYLSLSVGDKICIHVDSPVIVDHYCVLALSLDNNIFEAHPITIPYFVSESVLFKN